MKGSGGALSFSDPTTFGSIFDLESFLINFAVFSSWQRIMSNLLNIDENRPFTHFHLEKDFLEILALIKISGISLAWVVVIRQGQSSLSVKTAKFGFQ